VVGGTQRILVYPEKECFQQYLYKLKTIKPSVVNIEKRIVLFCEKNAFLSVKQHSFFATHFDIVRKITGYFTMSQPGLEIDS